MKSSVQDELTIPPQRRYVVGVDMGKVERHVGLFLSKVTMNANTIIAQVYDESMRQALDELGIDANGVIQGELNIPLLRAWLRKLRAVATHPQVGMLGDRGRILGEEGHLKTIANVLQVRLFHFTCAGLTLSPRRICKSRLSEKSWILRKQR
jgi:E3 ubiquitin-protein ligase SHPRH